MRLKKIKLAGFKSFVDPTVVLLESNLTAVVGPNGCGKSNIVDAVRWVIGESSAKQLRGASLTDVIFNGSTHRKPVGKASIELVFDNTQGKLGAAYANYNEISIKREISRDGQSQFYLNGVKCRKRDITDLFLGTGLGPSSYAIIEQGVVSQLIESKPEELRSHFEEAAGISKYRERRKETETRIRNTRENLDRLSDLREEIQKQLERLKRQASTAERYKILKQEQRLLKAQWHVLEYSSLTQRIEEQNQHLNTQTTVLEESIATQRHIDLNIEQVRVKQTEANQNFNLVQADFYQLGTDIAKKEQMIQNIKQNTEQLLKDLERVEQAWHETEQHYQEDTAKIATLSAELEATKPEAENAKEALVQIQMTLEQAEETQRHNQIERDNFQVSLSRVEQKVKLETSQAHHLQQKIENIETHIDKLVAQHQALKSDMSPEALDTLSHQSITLKMTLEALQERISKVNEDIQHQRQNNAQYQAERDETRQGLQKLHHQKVSLEALQQAAVKKHDAGTEKWLSNHGWSERPRLVESLEVESGWETAVETALAPYLEAICTDTLEDFNTVANHITDGRLTLFNTNAAIQTSPLDTNLLATKVKAPLCVHNLLAGIYIADTTTEALNMLSQLSAEASIITRDGIWFSPYWVRINKVKDETAGVLQRQQSIKEIAEHIKKQEAVLAMQDEQTRQGQDSLSELEESRDIHQREFRETSSAYSELHANLSAKQAELAQIEKRKAVLEQDIEEQKEQLRQANTQLAHLKEIVEQSQAEQETYQQQKIVLSQAQDLERAQLNTLRESVRIQKQKVDESLIRLSGMENQKHYLQENIGRTQQQRNQLNAQRDALQVRKESLSTPLPELEIDLQALLEKRLNLEKDLNQAREQVTQMNEQLAMLEKQRTDSEQHVQVLREGLEKIRIAQSSAQTHLENQLEQIKETGYTIADAQIGLPEDATAVLWQEKTADIDAKIQRLGPINLAAIEEYEELSQRKIYLDSQDQDLCEALTTLENAIQKIDKESRARLKETFEQANEHFKVLFSKMFNGGNASLEFVGDEVLSAGVLIRAQPPGKRNALLHMLSGGEKALTAIALVFALFQLNPAPFCILDEVDAPLDDANVGRFCRLVEAMSSSVQFLFISHNKVTMEMAKQLVGVTMHEPGTSRLVSVDIEQAIAAIEEK
ncbi:MAG: chromosome segregation protein [Gammaproteobacteria bacterium]|nr:chromosome segregation protein [Gammaproteobacteria bacterium]